MTAEQESGSIVNAVADHRHAMPLALQVLYDGRLVLGQYRGLVLGNPNLLCHGAGGAGVVAGQHHRLQPGLPQALDRHPRIGFELIGDGDQAGELPIGGQGHHSVTHRLQGLELLARGREIYSRASDESWVAHRDVVPFDRRRHPFARRGLEVCGRWK